MSVWLCIPSARANGGTLSQWKNMGYKLAVWRNPNSQMIDADYLVKATYQGYGSACNHLVRAAFEKDPECEFVVCAGDDTLPDMNHRPDEIADDCSAHFAGSPLFPKCVGHRPDGSPIILDPIDSQSFGVMQPTGDRYAGGSIDRIAGSPWIGRSFCLRTYNGQGPYDPQYKHMFVDEALFEVANRLQCYWARPELIHLHQHFMRESNALDSNAVMRPVPAHLRVANSMPHWDVSKQLFLKQKSEGFREGMTLLADADITKPDPPAPKALYIKLCPLCTAQISSDQIDAHLAAHLHTEENLLRELESEGSPMRFYDLDVKVKA